MSFIQSIICHNLVQNTIDCVCPSNPQFAWPPCKGGPACPESAFIATTSEKNKASRLSKQSGLDYLWVILKRVQQDCDWRWKVRAHHTDSNIPPARCIPQDSPQKYPHATNNLRNWTRFFCGKLVYWNVVESNKRGMGLRTRWCIQGEMGSIEGWKPEAFMWWGSPGTETQDVAKSQRYCPPVEYVMREQEAVKVFGFLTGIENYRIENQSYELISLLCRSSTQIFNRQNL